MALPSINSINSNGEDPKDFLFGGTPIKLPEVVITTNKIPPPFPNPNSDYTVYMLNSPGIKGSIDILSGGGESKSQIIVQGITKGKTKVDINLISPPQITSQTTFEELVSTIILLANDTLEKEYNVSEKLKSAPAKDLSKPIYTIEGKIIDSLTQQVIGGVDIQDFSNDNFTTSRPNGEFTLEGPYKADENLIPDIFELIISTKGYGSTTYKPTKLDGTLITQTGPIELTPLKNSVEDEKMNLENYSKEQEALLKNSTPKDFVNTQTTKLTDQIKKRLIPAIAAMTATFGVSELSKFADTPSFPKGATKLFPISCPTDIEELNEAIARRNKLTKAINLLYKGILSIELFLDGVDKLISSSKIVIPAAQISLITLGLIPSTVGTPIPSGAYPVLNDALKKLKNIVKKNTLKSSQITFKLRFLILEVKKVINSLSLLDELIEHCAKEKQEETSNDTPLLESISVNNELLASTEEQELNGNPVVLEANGFTFDVVTVDGETDLDLKRRQAVAKNPAGIIMLKGEPSFSSNDQILIDELVFYIKQNDLKAD